MLCTILLGGLALAQAAPAPAPAPASASASVSLDQLEKRLEVLQKGFAQAQQNLSDAEAQLHAWQGAISETQNWITSLKAVPPATPPAPPKK